MSRHLCLSCTFGLAGCAHPRAEITVEDDSFRWSANCSLGACCQLTMTEHNFELPTARRSRQASVNQSGDNRDILPTILWMSNESLSDFKQAFIDRIRKSREATGWNQREMAEALHIPLKNYESYETRSLLPHYLVAQFARIARVPIEYLFTGRMPNRKRRAARPDMPPSPAPLRGRKASDDSSDRMSGKALQSYNS